MSAHPPRDPRYAAQLARDAARTDAPPVLLPYQSQWIEDRSPLKIAEKSRRVGLTWAEAADDALIAASSRGSNVFYISNTQDMALEYIEACAMWARAYHYAASEIGEGIFEDIDTDGETRHIKTYRIDFPGSGRRIVGLSSAPRNLRGKQGVIVLDEAAFADSLPALLKAAMAMLLWGDRVRIISTHNGAGSAFDELIQEVRAGKRKGSVHRITFRDAVEQGLYQRVCLRRGIPWSQADEERWVEDAYSYYRDDAAEELDVIPSQSGGAYFTIAQIEARMSPDTPLVRGAWPPEFAYQHTVTRHALIEAWCEEHLAEPLRRLDPNRAHALGGDFGRLRDLTVFDVLEEEPNLVNRVMLQVELSNCPFASQEQILYYILDRMPRRRGVALDATGLGAHLSELAAQRYGASVEQVKLNDAFYLLHFPRLKAAFEDATLDSIPRHIETRDDLRAIRVINGVPKLPSAPTQRADGPKLQRHGDSAIALLLAHYAMKHEHTPIEFQALGVERAGRSLGDYLGEAA